MKKLLCVLPLLALCLSMAFGQQRAITGRVMDEAGLPISGASILIKGTTTGISADASGNFTINAKTGDVLIVSAVGIPSMEVAVGKGASLNITLTRQGQNLQEVVVTALGIRRSKNLLPYSAQTVAGEELSKTRTNNFATSLSGKVSGLEIRQSNTLGGSTNIVLRGAKSFTQTNQALIVVDGMPFDNSNTNTANQRTGRGGYDYGNALSDINPDDIESINVLKGAAATALYGSRAANGVLQITTRKGRRGLGITVNTGILTGSVDKKTFVTYQKEYGAGYGDVYVAGGFYKYDVNGDGTPDDVVLTDWDGSWGPRFDPNRNVYHWDAFDPSSVNYKKPRPWVAAQNDPYTFFEKQLSVNNSVFLTGGDDKANFKLGYTRTNDEGILPNSKINKDLLNFNSSYRLAEGLTASASANYSRIEGLGRYGTGYDSKNPMQGFRQWWQTNVDIKEQKEAYFRTRKNVSWNWALDPSDLFNPSLIYHNNPYFERYENYEQDRRDRFFGNAALNYQVTDWLSIMGRVALDSYDEIQEERVAVGSLPTLISGLTTADNGEPSGYSRFNRSFREINYDLMANFDRNLSKDLNLKALVGGNVRNTKLSSILAKTNGGLAVPNLYTLSNTLNPLLPPTEEQSEVEVQGVFGGFTLTYQNMLTLDVTGRNDRSSTLPRNKNSYFYPSVSGGFVFSKLLPQAKWLDHGKLRANFAQVGNSAPALSVLDTYVPIASFGTATLFSVNINKNNPDLKPETTESVELGLELSALKNRIGLDLSLYNSKSKDQIVPVDVSSSTGYARIFKNAGTIRNRGIEVSLTGTPIKTRDFSWNVTLNWSINRNKVLSLYDTAKNLQISSFQADVTVNAALGQPYGTIRGSDYVYDAASGKRVVGANGFYLNPGGANNVIGNVNPDWIGGINNSLRYKDFSLSWLIDVRKGGDVFSLDMYYGLATGLYPETAGNNDLGNPVRNSIANGGGIINEGVTADGKENTRRVDISTRFGAYGYLRNPSSGFVYDASYVKLREAVLTYSLPQKLLNNINFVKGIDLSVVGRNLWLIHKNLPYSDPEETISSGNIQGLQGGAYPTVRSYGFNLRFKF